MAKYLPSCIFDKYKMIGTTIAIIAFSIFYLNLIVPFSDTTWLLVNKSANFTLTILFSLSCILVLCCSRLLLYHVKISYRITYFIYVLWLLLEVIILSLIYLLFTNVFLYALADAGWHFSFIPGHIAPWLVFGRGLLAALVCLVVPNVIADMYFVIAEKNRTIKLLEQSCVVTDNSFTGVGESMFTLFDVKGDLKLSVRSSNLFYIESDDNYIKVWYTDNSDHLKHYVIRCRLKTIEDSFRETSLIRCHRQYIVNSLNVKMLRKDPDGYNIYMSCDEVPPIPVTKTYKPQILALFNDKLA